MQKIVMPAVDYKQISNEVKLQFRCECSQELNKCRLINTDSQYYLDCGNCALYSVENYKKWKSQQPKETDLVKWPISSKERFFVLPRVLVNIMSDKWKKRFLSLLNEYNKKHVDNKFWEPIKFRVSATKYGKYIKMPKIFK